jgi:hypothetical protein
MYLYVVHESCYSVSGINQLSLFHGEVRWELNSKVLLRWILCYKGLTDAQVRYSADYLT